MSVSRKCSLGALVLFCLALVTYRHQLNTCFTEDVNEESVEPDDPCLLEHIRTRYLKKPSGRAPHLQNSNDNPSDGQSQRILDILGNKTKGFYVECGAFDGETLSNSLYMETQLGWEGLLIEADPFNFNILMTKQRNAWALPNCLSTAPYPQKVLFKQQGLVGGIRANRTVTDLDQRLAANGAHLHGFTQVRCFPLYSILLAVGRTKVDYFSLDIEGDELRVLKTIPWHLVDIRTITVEVWAEDVQQETKEFMSRQGYVFAGTIQVPSMTNDLIFIKK